MDADKRNGADIKWVACYWMVSGPETSLEKPGLSGIRAEMALLAM